MNSQIFNKMIKAKDKVKSLLEEFPHLRDSDERLIASFWFFQIGENKFESLSARQLMNMYVSNQLQSAETIRRCRAKLQEDNISLRGKSYQSRRDEGEQFTKEVHLL
jgi:hypothetical protein